MNLYSDRWDTGSHKTLAAKQVSSNRPIYTHTALFGTCYIACSMGLYKAGINGASGAMRQ